MNCKKCEDLGVVFLEGKTIEDIIKKCDCVINKVKTRSKRSIYENSSSFMDNEAAIQFASDYPDSESIMKANGSASSIKSSSSS